MGELIERVKLSLLAYGDGIPDNFKNNSLFFYEKYQKSGQDVLSINIGEINPGGFYFFTYLDDSNWMKFSPVFVADYKKLNKDLVNQYIKQIEIFDKNRVKMVYKSDKQ